MTNRPTVVWTEIPVTDLEASAKFYADVFGWSMSIEQMGPNPGANFNGSTDGVHGHLYPGKPSREGPTIHFAVPDSLEAASQRCTDAGGSVVGPAVDIPPGRFTYAYDPDGNSIGLFEFKAG